MKNILSNLIIGVGLVVILPQLINAQWVQANGAQAWIRSFAVCGTNIFAGSVAGGIFLSKNNGESWSPVDSGLPTPTSIFSMAVSGDSVFAGTDGYGVYVSSNNGISWNSANSGLPANTPVMALAVGGINMFAGTADSGVFRSTNRGASWSPVNSGLTYPSVWSLAIRETTVVAGAYFGGVFLTTDYGTSWNQANSGFPVQNCVQSLVVSGTDIFAGTFGNGVFRSVDGGMSWTAIDSGVSLTLNSIVCSFALSGSNVFAGTVNHGVFLTNNDGASWTAVDSGLLCSCVYSLAVSGGTLFAGTDLGVWRRPLSEMVGVINPESQRMILQQANLKIRSLGPVGTTVTLDFFLPHSDPVTVKIYNPSGHEIASLVSKYFESGQHSLTWNTRNVAAGCYIVKMQTGAMTLVKSLLLLR